MSLDKAIQYGKEKRKPYTNSKSFDTTCRNHNSCSWCKENRTHTTTKRRQAAEYQIQNWQEECECWLFVSNPVLK